MSGTLPAFVLPGLASALLVAVMMIIQRWALKGKSSPTGFVGASYAVLVMLLVAIYVVRWGFSWPSNLRPGFWIPVAGTIVVNFGIQYLNSKALTYKEGEASLVSPLSAMTPGLLTLAAVTLGEFPGLAGFGGIVLIAVGSWILLSPTKPKRWWEYMGPFYRLLLIFRYRELSSADQQKALVVWLVLGAAMLSTAGLLCDGLYARRAGDLQGMWLGYSTLFLALSVGFLVHHRIWAGKKVRHEWAADKKKLLLAVLLYAACNVGAFWLLQPTYAETLIAYVGSLSRTRILFVVALGYFLLGEKDARRRFVVAFIVVAGIILIATESVPERLTDRLEGVGF